MEAAASDNITAPPASFLWTPANFVYSCAVSAGRWWSGGLVPATQQLPVTAQYRSKIGATEFTNLPGSFWNGSQWTESAPDTVLPESSTLSRSADGLRVATLNVLTNGAADSYATGLVDYVLATQTRYDYIVAELLPSLRADVICFNEVSPRFLRTLLASPVVRRHYFVSSHRESERVSHWVVVLSRYPFVRCCAADPQAIRAVCLEICVPLRLSSGTTGEAAVTAAAAAAAPLAATVATGDRTVRVVVCAVHLMAYQERMLWREVQLARLNAFVDEQFAPDTPRVVLGDWNLHASEEQRLICAPYVDVWVQKHGSTNAGYTWDPVTNPLIRHYLPGDERRMRLDRVAVADAQTRLGTLDIEIVADQPILPAGSPFRHVLRASDHYGLLLRASL